MKHTSQEYINDSCYRLITRSNIRKGITSRKSVQEGKEDRLCLLLEEAAKVISDLQVDLELTRAQRNASNRRIEELIDTVEKLENSIKVLKENTNECCI